jgi:integrase
VQWFAAAYLPGQASWERVDSQDIQQWMTWLLDRYSNAYASNQYRALQQFLKWLSAEDELPDPMERLQPPRVTDKLVPVFTEGELSRLEQACAGRSFAQRRDTAIIAVFRATGIRLAELAGIVYHADDPRRSDIDLWQREITVRGKGGRVCEIQNAETVLGVLREHCSATRWLGISASRWVGMTGDGKGPAGGPAGLCGARVVAVVAGLSWSAVRAGDGGGDQGDVGVVEAAQDAGEVDGDVVVAEAGGDAQDGGF